MSLDEYWKLAYKIIIKFKLFSLLKDSENIGEVAKALMWADTQYNHDTHPHMSIGSYRNLHVKRALSKLFKRMKSNHQSVYLLESDITKLSLQQYRESIHD